ncbi:uncharacterized protein [Musca autumnalis]|uniref:uncharacterized protein n=1 Tax=Musca autumnalis TaxID=221902 RepID=UPI003CF23729
MSTPRKNKNYNYTSPYSKPIQQYASQNDEYISLEMGGRSQEGRETSSTTYTKKMNQRRPNYNGGYYSRNNYSNENVQKSWSTPRKGNENGNRGSSQNSNSQVYSYIHSSMTEDPWSDLMARMEFLDKSIISLKEQSPVLEMVDNENDHNAE